MKFKRKPVILLVNSDPEYTSKFKTVVHGISPSIKVSAVQSRHEMLDYLERKGKFDDSSQYPFPRLIILSLSNFAEMNLEALQDLRSHSDFRRTPVIICTDSEFAKNTTLSYKLGANGVIHQSAVPETKIEVIEGILNYWFQTVELPPY
jgi:CheY-like chemotaxis protein